MKWEKQIPAQVIGLAGNLLFYRDLFHSRFLKIIQFNSNLFLHYIYCLRPQYSI